MPKIVQLQTVAIYIYADDHWPPHFHVRGPGIEVQVEIETLAPMRGRYDRRGFAEAIGWAAENIDLLRAKWKVLNERD